MRTRIIPKMLNDEVEEYLTRNDIVIVPVGTVEMHGGFPLDSETVVSEAFALKMAYSASFSVLYFAFNSAYICSVVSLFKLKISPTPINSKAQVTTGMILTRK